MKCDDVREQLPDYWTGAIEEAPKSEMQAHFAACSACRAEAETLGAIKELDIQWVNWHSIHADQKLSLKLRATEGGQGIANARLTVRLARTNGSPSYIQARTNGSGDAELEFQIEESSLYESSILVQVNAEGRTATRKFQLKRVEA